MKLDEFYERLSSLDDAIYQIIATGQFKNSLKLSYKQGKNLELLLDIVYKLSKGLDLDEKYRSHKLTGYGEDFWECHIKPDWLLIWKVYTNELALVLVDTGTHSYLF